MENKRVLLGMSGGTDSSVSAILLKEAGYEVTGITFRFYELNNSQEYLEDAKELALKLGIEHITYDARDIFKDKIINYFIQEYMAGRTPVPCTLCNNYLKWPLLARIADENNIGFIATGHYVKKEYIDGYYYITCGADPDKDQSFFLWGLKQDTLSKMILPLGDLTKQQVREVASARGFRKIATKKDSLGVCFCPMDYRSFLRKNVDLACLKAGKFYDEHGNFMGDNEGYPFYTVGQRRGLGIYLNRAVFVKEIEPQTNRVILGDLHSLEKTEMLLKNWNAINRDQLLDNENIIVKIRYRKQKNRCRVTCTPDNLLHVQLYDPLTAIAPGQAAAFYLDNRVLGGGIIV